MVNGWDERDYKLWSDIRQLPSYGLIAGNADDPMLSRIQVLKLLETHAEERFDVEWNKRLSNPAKSEDRRRARESTIMKASVQ